VLARLEAKGYLIAIVNIRQRRAFSDLHKVNVASTYIFMDKGEQTYRHTGHMMEIEVLDWLKKPEKKEKASLI